MMHFRNSLRVAAGSILLVGAVACGGLSDGQVNIIGNGGGANSAGAENGGGANTGGTENNGGGAGIIMSTDPPTVVTVTPAEGATDAEPNGTITLTFNESLNADTVNPTSITVAQGAAPVAGTVTLNSNTVVFTPSSRLNLLGTYTVTASTSVTDLDGTPMQQPFTATFTVRDGVWKSRLTIAESDGLSGYYGVVPPAIDAKGNALFVWAATPEGSKARSVYGRFRTPGTGLGEPFEIDQTEVAIEGSVSLAMNAAGDAVVAWVQTEGTFYRVYARRYIAGQWEEPPLRVDDYDITASIQELTTAAAPNGDFHVLWRTYSTYNYVYGRHASGAAAWDEVDSYITGGTTMGTPKLAFDNDGNGFLVLASTLSSVTQLAVQRYSTAAKDWSGGGNVTDSAGVSTYNVVADAAGGAMALWRTADATKASRFTKARGWSAATTLDTGTYYDEGSPGLARSSIGFTGLWPQSLPDGRDNVYASSYDGVAWATESTLVSGGELSVSEMSYVGIGHDSLDNGVALWFQVAPIGRVGSDLFFARYLAQTSRWSAPTLVVPSPDAEFATKVYTQVSAAVAANGVATAQWIYSHPRASPSGIYATVFE